MNFSQTFKNATSGKWSPNSQLVASVSDKKLTIRDRDSLELALQITCTLKIQSVLWSPCSQYFICTHNGSMTIWSVLEEDYNCLIDCGAAGMSYVCWAPDSRSIITIEEHGLRLNIWSLVDDSVQYIKYPKYSNANTFKFSADGQFLAVLEHPKEGKDFIAIYSVQDAYARVSFFPLSNVPDTIDFDWSPANDQIAVWNSVFEFVVAIYDVTGHEVGLFNPNCSGMGVKCVAWSPDAKHIAVGAFDDKLYILSNTAWKPIYQRLHKADLNGKNIIVYAEDELEAGDDEQEAEEKQDDMLEDSVMVSQHQKERNVMKQAVLTDKPKRAFLKKSGVMGNMRNKTKAALLEPVLMKTDHVKKNPEEPSKYYVEQTPFSCPYVRADRTRPDPSIGISEASWSADGEYLFTRSDRFPRVLWIWQTKTFQLQSVLVQAGRIRSAKWSPTESCVAICTNNPKLYTWSTDGVAIVDIPSQSPFTVRKLTWAKDGETMLILGKSQKFCVCYMNADDVLESDSEKEEEEEEVHAPAPDEPATADTDKTAEQIPPIDELDHTLEQEIEEVAPDESIVLSGEVDAVTSVENESFDGESTIHFDDTTSEAFEAELKAKNPHLKQRFDSAPFQSPPNAPKAVMTQSYMLNTPGGNENADPLSALFLEKSPSKDEDDDIVDKFPLLDATRQSFLL